MVGNLVAGKRIAQASGRDLGQLEDNDLVKKVNRYLLQLKDGKKSLPYSWPQSSNVKQT